jgi:hypothetical protein
LKLCCYQPVTITFLTKAFGPICNENNIGQNSTKLDHFNKCFFFSFLFAQCSTTIRKTTICFLAKISDFLSSTETFWRFVAFNFGKWSKDRKSRDRIKRSKVFTKLLNCRSLEKSQFRSLDFRSFDPESTFRLLLFSFQIDSIEEDNYLRRIKLSFGQRL